MLLLNGLEAMTTKLIGYGYSAGIIKSNRQASPRRIGVKLGRICIDRAIPVKEVASQLGVSRQTIYNWFCGVNDPTPDAETMIARYLTDLDDLY